jgi:hypothetical protein
MKLPPRKWGLRMPKSFFHATEWSFPHTYGMCKYPNHSSTPRNGAQRTHGMCKYPNHSSTPRNGAQRTHGMCKYPNHSSTPRNEAQRTHMGCANTQIICPRRRIELSAHECDVRMPVPFIHTKTIRPVHATESSSPHANGVCECPNNSSTPLNGASRTQIRCANLHYSGGWSDLKAPRKCTNVQFVAE